MLLGAAAVVATAQAGAYRDVTGQYIQNPAYIPGLQGALTATADGVGETYNGAFNLYQTLHCFYRECQLRGGKLGAR